jgi:hypothetical protein
LRFHGAGVVLLIISMKSRTQNHARNMPAMIAIDFITIILSMRGDSFKSVKLSDARAGVGVPLTVPTP